VLLYFATDHRISTDTEMHQYLDSDGSGTSATCVSSTIGAERLADATTWLQQNKLRGVLGEIGAGSNSVCISAVQGALCSMQEAGGVWLGALWWAAGPWWGTVSPRHIEPCVCIINKIFSSISNPSNRPAGLRLLRFCLRLLSHSFDLGKFMEIRNCRISMCIRSLTKMD
jgi:aryl-phospho-beta-D-glucosidase BglC (GH1 family)